MSQAAPEPDTSDRSEQPFASVIVPVKDGLELLQRCVQALLDQDYPQERYEIIIVDNGSAVSPAGKLPGGSRVTLLSEPGPGSYRARNTGLATATGEILAFTDADCRPDRQWLSTAVRFLTDHPDVDMIGGRVDFSFAGGRPVNGPEWIEFAEGFPQDRYLANGYAVTANMVTRRAVFDRVGLFNAELKSGGDGEWGRRVRDSGGLQRYVPESFVVHPARDTWAELKKKTVRTTAGLVQRKASTPHPRRALIRLIMSQIVRSLIMVPLAVLRHPKLPGALARLRFLGARWRADAVIVAVLAKGVFSPNR